MPKAGVSGLMLPVLAVVISFAGVFVAPSLAEETAEDVAALKKRIAVLEAQVTMLNEECSTLRAENALLKNRTFHEKEEQQVPAKAGEKSETTAETKPSTRAAGGSPKVQEGGKVYVSVLDALNKLPPELRPTNDGTWDKFTLPKVEDWLDKNFLGESVDFKLTISNCKARKHPFEKDKDGNPLWQVTVDFDDEQFKYASMTFKQKIENLTLSGDDKFAKRAELKLTNGLKLRVKAKVKHAHFQRWGDTKLDVNLSLTDVKFEPDILKP